MYISKYLGAVKITQDHINVLQITKNSIYRKRASDDGKSGI